MAKLHGSSAEMDAQARKLSDAELKEIVDLNKQPAALKARAELARRKIHSIDEVWVKVKKTLFFARIAAYTVMFIVLVIVIGIILAVI